MKKSTIVDESGTCIICSHVALLRKPILLAVCDVAVRREDSGWQFLCGSEHSEDDVASAQIWSIADVLSYDPTLAGHLNEEPGTRLSRNSKFEHWKRAKSSDAEK